MWYSSCVQLFYSTKKYVGFQNHGRLSYSDQSFYISQQKCLVQQSWCNGTDSKELPVQDLVKSQNQYLMGPWNESKPEEDSQRRLCFHESRNWKSYRTTLTPTHPRSLQWLWVEWGQGWGWSREVDILEDLKITSYWFCKPKFTLSGWFTILQAMTNLNWPQTRHLAEAHAGSLEEIHSYSRPQRIPYKNFPRRMSSSQ